jgi:hypothetical protein
MEKSKIYFWGLLVALLISLVAIFLPWISISFFITISISGWGLHWAIKVLAGLLIVCGVLVYFVPKVGKILSIVVPAGALGYLAYKIFGSLTVDVLGQAQTIKFSELTQFLGFGFYVFIIGLIATIVFAILSLIKSED